MHVSLRGPDARQPRPDPASVRHLRQIRALCKCRVLRDATALAVYDADAYATRAGRHLVDSRSDLPNNWRRHLRRARREAPKTVYPLADPRGFGRVATG